MRSLPDLFSSLTISYCNKTEIKRRPFPEKGAAVVVIAWGYAVAAAGSGLPAPDYLFRLKDIAVLIGDAQEIYPGSQLLYR